MHTCVCTHIHTSIVNTQCWLQYSTKLFPRWKNGSCIEAPPQIVPGQDEPVTFTFFSDVSMHPDVVDMANTVQQSIHNTVNQILHYLSSSWKKKYRPLWKLQRVCVHFVVYIHTYIRYYYYSNMYPILNLLAYLVKIY